jgi:hypothetical protein
MKTKTKFIFEDLLDFATIFNADNLTYTEICSLTYTEICSLYIGLDILKDKINIMQNTLKEKIIKLEILK